MGKKGKSKSVAEQLSGEGEIVQKVKIQEGENLVFFVTGDE